MGGRHTDLYPHMAVHRVICRWDFGLSPKLMDQPGALLDALDINGRWDVANESSSKRQFTLRGKGGDGSVYETFTFSPMFAVFSVEWVEGVPLRRLSDHKQLLELFRCLDTVKQFGGIRTLRRSGVRFTQLECVAPELARDDMGEQVLLDRVLERSGPRLTELVERAAGKASDASVKLVGSHDDKINYTINYGPFNHVEVPKFFPEIAGAWLDSNGADFMCDADFWEADFDLTVSAHKWASPIVRRFDNVISLVTDGLKGNGDGPNRAD